MSTIVESAAATGPTSWHGKRITGSGVVPSLSGSVPGQTFIMKRWTLEGMEPPD